MRFKLDEEVLSGFSELYGEKVTDGLIEMWVSPLGSPKASVLLRFAPKPEDIEIKLVKVE